MFSFLKASAPAPRIDSARTDAEYKKLRWQVFAGVFIGYAAYYLIRKNFSLAIPYLIEEYGFTKADLGTVGVALSLAYGFSKFIMGNVSDRSNPKYFITIGLLGSASAGYVMGKLVDLFGWDGGFYALIVSCFLGFFFIAFTLFHKPNAMK